MNYGSFDPVHPALVTAESDGDRARMRLLDDFHYRDPQGDRHTTEKGYLTDGASIPRFFWSLVGQPYGIYLRAAIIHDKLCDLADESATVKERHHRRERADLTFYFACLCCGCDYALAQKLLVGVRIGALCFPWKPRTAAAVPRSGAAADFQPPEEAELQVLWGKVCRQVGLGGPGLEAVVGGAAGSTGGMTPLGVRRGGTTPPGRGGGAGPEIQPLRGLEDLRALDALILAQAGGSAG